MADTKPRKKTRKAPVRPAASGKAKPDASVPVAPRTQPSQTPAGAPQPVPAAGAAAAAVPAPLTPAQPPLAVPAVPRAASPQVRASGHSHAATIVIQWLCYSLWIWLLAVLGWTLSTVLPYFLADDGARYDTVTYMLPSLLVLLPIALVLDLLYARRDLIHKQGFAAVVLVLNAVVVFLAALAAVVVAVAAAVRLVLNPDTSAGVPAVIASAGAVAVLAILLFVRMVGGGRLKLFAAVFPWIMTLAALAVAAGAAAGPVRHEYDARTDRLIEDNLPNLSQAIQDDARTRGTLPPDLGGLSFTPYTRDSQKLLDRRLVTYRVIRQPAVTGPETAQPVDLAEREARAGQYELCVTYAFSRGNSNGDGSSRAARARPATFIDTTSHGSGRQCYVQAVYRY